MNFKENPYVIPCLFHYAQSLIKKFKFYNIMNKKMNKRAYELLKNLEILCFIDNKKITYYFNYLKNNIFKEKMKKILWNILKKFG